ncbi:MAG: hypothetical protein HC934_11075 [Acaryochloridaceae cyanobacterium SU_2_1]|nr:hypothetical protein [Acaryochloridaceae cyanobacterium SU_2_1]
MNLVSWASAAGGADRQQLDAVLRAAHSIKGGAALMGFMALSHLAHRMEDFFKVLKVGRVPVDGELESSLLKGMDFMRQVVGLNQQGQEVEEEWLEIHAQPTLDSLYERIGDPTPEDEAAVLSADVGEDMAVMLFETEVEDCLQRLESQLATAEVAVIVAEFESSLEELAGLAEMLDFESFQGLCQSMRQALQSGPSAQQQRAIAALGLQELRRSQAMVLVGQKDAIPACLDLSNLELSSESPTVFVGDEISEATQEDIDLTLDALDLDLDMAAEVLMATEELQDFAEADQAAVLAMNGQAEEEEAWAEIDDWSESLTSEATELLTALAEDHQPVTAQLRPLLPPQK